MEDTRGLLWWLEAVFTIIITGFGLTGNILTLLVLARRSSASTQLLPSSLRFFLIALAITDSLILLWPCFTYWILYATSGLIVYNLSETGCRLGMFMVYFLLHLSPWILVFITIERVVVVVFPLHIKYRFTFKRAILAFTFTVFFFTILDAHLLFHFHLKPDNFVVQNVTNKSELDFPLRAVCVYNERHTFFMFKIWNWIDFVFAFGIPFLTLFIGNSLIIRTLISQESFWRTSSLRPEVNRRTSQSKRWTKVSVILSLAFIMLALPIVVYQIGQPFWVPEQPDQATRNTLELIQVILHILLYTNSAINVVLFVLLGSARLRKEFMKPFRDCVCSVCKCIRKNTRGNLQTTEMTATRRTFLGSES